MIDGIEMARDAIGIYCMTAEDKKNDPRTFGY